MTNRIRSIAALGAIAALALTGCATTGPDAGGAAEPGAESVTIEHALGTAEIPADVERVVTLGWGSTEAVLALGIVPVGISYQSYGANEEGIEPWVVDELDALGGETTVLPNSQETPVEAIAALEPDLILATYSGVTQDEYDLLDAIAPTVAYPEKEWSTPWQEVITTAGTALQREDEADAIIDDISAELATVAEEHPQFAGKTIIAAADFEGAFYGYTPADPRVEVLFELGFENAPALEGFDPGDGSFFFTASNEQLDQLESDVLLLYFDDQATADTYLASSTAATLPQVAAGTVAPLVGASYVAAVSPPTALSVSWGLDALVDALEQAAPAA
ncbi:iron-siderophore ABC transporter substrate-binding protein [Arenivirga flava]|uniref:Periplasmic binding protein n=1 Tax=Arenivirga flava TaxID=1930060 RepID=A0AA37UNN9_9MICO|nr:iron-siderophore ABC transporter substrate-binding protein [Arenivirga flava]GMA29375.1 periplasmic binding protein [Arenivirga flava]